MRMGLSVRGSKGIRLFVALLAIAGGLTFGGQAIAAQGTASSGDSTSYTSQDYGWSITWDAAQWQAQGGDAPESVLLGRLNGPYTIVTFQTFPASDSEHYCTGYQPQSASQRTFDLTQDYGHITPPYGSTTLTYLVSPQPGDTGDEVHYVICSSLNDQQDELQIVFIAKTEDFDAQIPVFDTLLEGLTLPPVTTTAGTPAPVTYTDDTYHFSLSYDGNTWYQGPRGEGIMLIDGRPNGSGSSLNITGTSAYGSSVADCIAAAPMEANGSPDAQVRSFAGDATLADGLGIEGTQVTVFVNEFAPQGAEENWIAVACVPLNDSSVLVIQLTADESRIVDAATIAKPVIDTITISQP